MMILITAVLWCGAFTFQPFFTTLGKPGRQIGGLIYLWFSPLCHQDPERSILLFGYPMAVCSRCAGIYYGTLLGILLYPWLHRQYEHLQTSVRWLCISAVPMLIDVGLAHTGILSTGTTIRAFTGIIPGCISSCYIVPGILDWLSRKPINQ
ncbi:DUF2085 domain-containing protein [bacterium]|nr:DUF2085 domain-containing protein [bacterium]